MLAAAFCLPSCELLPAEGVWAAYVHISVIDSITLFSFLEPNSSCSAPTDGVREDMCGFEEVTVSPEPIKTRPNRGELQNVTYPHVEAKQLSSEERAIIGGG